MKLLAIILLTTSLQAFADHHEEENFDKIKTTMLDALDKKIQSMTQARNCIQGAKDKDDVRKCRESMRAEHKALREKMKERREELKTQFRKNKQAKQQKK